MTISFSKKLYNLKAIQKSIEAYNGLGVFSIKKDKKNIKVEINDIDKDVKDIIKDEFCNYVFNEIKRNQWQNQN